MRDANERRPPPTYVVTLRPLPDVDVIKALRALLKRALRSYGLKCTSVREYVQQERRTDHDSNRRDAT